MGYAAFRSSSRAQTGISPNPGPYRGRVIAVTDAKCIRHDEYQAAPIRGMVQKGICELTGTASPDEAWKRFVGPDDVVGIKMSPVGQPFVCSSPQMLNAVIEGLLTAGVKATNIIVYERYREILENTGIPKWVPEGVRTAWAADAYNDIQQDIEGYDPEHYVDLPLVLPQFDLDNIKARRSFAAQFITRQVTKLVNLPVLKSHNAAGVTGALKNLSHGLVNNVSRSHSNLADFIPPVVSLPVIRGKAVLHILDGTRGLYDGGPGVTKPDFVWDHKTIYFATDPVAMDRVGLSVVDEKRRKSRMPRIADAKMSSFKTQPEHIDAAGKAGLGEWDLAKIELRTVKL
ncbi:MAG: DUF362 domain-containing protein [Acidobacteriia bacterium]|nr:DUF362 domain-containing protein [Terriglobia bacterium]